MHEINIDVRCKVLPDGKVEAKIYTGYVRIDPLFSATCPDRHQANKWVSNMVTYLMANMQ